VRDLLFKNLGWKALSLAIAVALWFILVGEQELTTSASAPVILRNLPSDLEISSEVPDRIHIEIQGPIGRLSHLSNPVVILDLDSVSQPGERTFTIRQSNLNLPPGVTLARAVPAYVRLRFERRLVRQVPVRVRLAGHPPDGYHIVRQEVVPPMVTVVGPESRVRLVEFAETDAIDLSALISETEYQVSTFVNDDHVRVSDGQRVAVRIAVERQAP